MTTWLVSDQHFGHANIIRYCGRPFMSVAQMNATLIQNHNSVVQDGDEVWHLGDFSLSERLVPEILPLLRGTHRLVAGNHDACHPSRRGWKAAVERYRTYGFREVCIEARIGPFKASHFPYAADSADVRYPEWRPVDDGGWLLCGHIHERWCVRNRMINVGVDQWSMTPVTLDSLLAYT